VTAECGDDIHSEFLMVERYVSDALPTVIVHGPNDVPQYSTVHATFRYQNVLAHPMTNATLTIRSGKLSNNGMENEELSLGTLAPGARVELHRTFIAAGFGGELLCADVRSDQTHFSRAAESVRIRYCNLDLDQNGCVDAADLREFLEAYVSGDLRADHDHSRAVDNRDMKEFLVEFDKGC
jgi:hypothetical protein